MTVWLDVVVSERKGEPDLRWMFVVCKMHMAWLGGRCKAAHSLIS